MKIGDSVLFSLFIYGYVVYEATEPHHNPTPTPTPTRTSTGLSGIPFSK